MKKIFVTGIVVLIAMFFVTCDDVLPKEEVVEYTDVVYSEDGSRVTLYLDGVGVPITPAQRAMSTRLSKMAYDYLEVVFIAIPNGAIPPVPPTRVVARAQWELGQPAGISGVPRGIDYKYVDNPVSTYAAVGSTAGSAIALMAVGRKDGKTLLGIGHIAEVDNSATYDDTAVGTNGGPNKDTDNWKQGIGGDGYPLTPYAKINSNNKSVTFYIQSVKTGLLVGTETVYDTTIVPPAPQAATVNKLGILCDSLKFTTASNTIKADSKRTELGNSLIPTYPLPVDGAAVQTAEYTFEGAAKTYKQQIVFSSVKKVNVEQRFPRYLYNGGYQQLAASIDMRSTVEHTLVSSAVFTNVIPLTFTRIGTGIFSFYLEIPVYILSNDKGTNTGELSAVPWKIRTGLGSELYSLDDGLANGGCVLMTIGKLSLDDWLEIQWEWVP